MANAYGSHSQIGYVMETDYGVTPTTPSIIELPLTQSSLNLDKEEYDDNTIRPDGMERYSVSGNRSVGGSLDAEFSSNNFDDMLTSLMQNDWTSNVLKNGTTRKSFTLEESHSDTAQFIVTAGVIVDKFELTVPASGFVTAKFDVIGMNQSPIAATSIDAGGGYTPAQARIPFTDGGTSGFIKEGGTTIGYVSAYTLSVDRGHTRNWAIGTNFIYDLTPSLSKVTGSISVYFKDAVMYNKFINGSASSLDLKLDDGTHTYEFNLPNIKYTGASKTVSGQGTIQLTMPFKALFDAASNSHVVITRS